MSVFFLDSNCELWYDKVEKLGIEYNQIYQRKNVIKNLKQILF